MKRLKHSILWTIQKETYQYLIETSTTLSEILKSLNMSPNGGNLHTLKRVLTEYNLDYSKFSSGLGHNKGKKLTKVSKILNEELFTANSAYSRSVVKKRILKQNLIPYKCEQCGQEPFWNGKELVLVLDHINGISNDHRLENLRFLCPNCNAQQDTFCGKHLKTLPRKINNEEKLKLKQLYLEQINEKRERILSYSIDFSKDDWIEKIANLENVSHTSVKRFMKKYMSEFYYTKCYIRRNQFV